MILSKTLRRIPAKLYHTETLDYRSRLLAAGGTISETSLDYAEKFVQDCKNALLWNKLDEVGLFLGNQLTAALVKLKYTAAGLLINNNFTAGNYTERGASGGLLGDGVTKYLDTGLNVQNLPTLGHLGFYLREDVAAAGNRGMMGAFTATEQYILGSSNPASDVFGRYGQLPDVTAVQPLVKGFYTLSRTAANQLYLFHNGNVVDADTNTVASVKPNGTVPLWGWNYITGANMQNFLPARGSFYSIGQGLSPAEAQALYQAVQTLQRNLNRSI